jgi:crotonobetainyl-CoA:carnitine CoA-transferase CaiB-like acyl-CoA transferase
VTAPANTPLAGTRILSLAEQYPGPFATMILADLGADVILIERPQGGDPTRRFSGHFEALSRNKRSVTLNLKHPAGQEAFWRLAATADAIVEGYKPGVVDRLGIGPAQVRARFPRMVYTSISSFGQTGPMAPRGGHDISIQGMAGFVTGDDPTPAPLPLGDLAAAMFATVGILAALLGREQTEHGSYVDVSMLDCLVSWRSTVLVSSLNGLDPAPYPPLDPGYGVFLTDTGELITLSIAGEDHQWRELCLALGLDSLAGLTIDEREQSKADIQKQLLAAFAGTGWPALASALASKGVGFGPVYTEEELARDPQIVARGVIVEMPDGTRLPRQPILFDGAGSTVTSRAPSLGQHTAELLGELGYAENEIADLVGDGPADND